MLSVGNGGNSDDQPMKCDCGVESSKDVPKFPWRCSCGAVWLSTTERRLPCVHLGKPTGSTVPTRCNCGESGIYRDVPVFRCKIHGVAIQRPQHGSREPQWDGVNCLTCEFREVEKPAPPCVHRGPQKHNINCSECKSPIFHCSKLGLCIIHPDQKMDGYPVCENCTERE